MVEGEEVGPPLKNRGEGIRVVRSFRALGLFLLGFLGSGFQGAGFGFSPNL